MAEDIFHIVDLHIARQLASRRHARGLSSNQLAQRLKLSAEAVESYEMGNARIPASDLYALANELDVDLSSFFPGHKPARRPGRVQADRAIPEVPNDPDGTRRTLELVRAFLSLPDEKHRRLVLALTQSLAGQTAEAAQSEEDGRLPR